jgi:hypothetical protein
MYKRFFPRVTAQLPAVVVNEDGIKFNVSTLDASSQGICIQCSIEQRNQLTPGGSYIRNRRPVELFLRLDLPDAQGMSNQVEARCHITFSRRIAKNVCHIGMRYTEIESDGHEKLMNYIESSMISPEYA